MSCTVIGKITLKPEWTQRQRKVQAQKSRGHMATVGRQGKPLGTIGDTLVSIKLGTLVMQSLALLLASFDKAELIANEPAKLKAQRDNHVVELLGLRLEQERIEHSIAKLKKARKGCKVERAQLIELEAKRDAIRQDVQTINDKVRSALVGPRNWK
ncbi:MAG: hypothetical protein A2Y38_16970 [Spirochaetes bacterium GWB1_59_5]|nr:MAG: hypothetical protein A2Y38_16970 [Spirochaetes bacterium GWB1_59_5]